ncbi:MAG: GNAT family N-acetyltransferase [Bacteroidetes bacterium]|nr:GNAT family N-acetyltransferase [Bacteroidota bacterium]
MIIAETERLILREMSAEDAEQAYLLNLDPEVIKYTGDEPFKTIEEARTFLENYTSYKKYGFGRWAVEDKNNNTFLGWCGLKYIEEENQHDIGFRFFKKHWGKGYATEAALACLSLGFETFKLPHIIGRAAKANTGSVNVLKKTGMSYLKDDECHGDEAVIYIIYKPEK